MADIEGETATLFYFTVTIKLLTICCCFGDTESLTTDWLGPEFSILANRLNLHKYVSMLSLSSQHDRKNLHQQCYTTTSKLVRCFVSTIQIALKTTSSDYLQRKDLFSLL